jgi:2-polyprenyl-3-methyl-5-hydroxy-6-metoxy-1,4-benzoquinol methylase
MAEIDSNRVKTFFEVPEKYLHKDFGIRIRREIIERLVKDFTFKNILDVGCGDGSISLPLLNLSRTLDLVDLSSNMLSLAKSKIPKDLEGNVVLQNTSLEKLNTNKKYDLILAIGLLAHVPDLDNAISKLHDKLATNGFLILQFSDCSKLVTKMSFISRKSNNYKLNRIYKKNLLSMVIKKHFELITGVAFATIFPGMGFLNNELLYKYCKYSINNKFFSLINSEYIMVLNRK